MIIRRETPADRRAIHELTRAAFADAPHRSGREQELVDALRDAEALVLSLVADCDADVRGHIAFTDVTIDGCHCHWCGLGPVAVHPQFQGRGTGRQLIETGLGLLAQMQRRGCTVLGDPAFYGRSGFAADVGLRLDSVPPEFFLAKSFGAEMPRGKVEYHRLFSRYA